MTAQDLKVRKIGILGAGQLARMLSLSARPLGIQTLCYAETITPTIDHMSEVIVGSLNDQKQLQAFAKQVDVVTYETENVSMEALNFLETQGIRLTPNKKVLEIAQDRYLEKSLCKSLDIPTPEFFNIEQKSELHAALKKLGFPAVLKTRTLGYDGKGQSVLKTESDIDKAWDLLSGVPLILEQFIPFVRELSMIAVRTQEGTIFYYPLTQNYHREGILRISLAPITNATLQKSAERLTEKLLTHLNYVGIFALELFEYSNALYVNEMAPRVHNSGHWTMNGAAYSQFENHVRAVCGLPIVDTSACGYSAMFNMIGEPLMNKEIFSLPGVHVHSYEKEPRLARKLGHINLNSADEIIFKKSFEELKQYVAPEFILNEVQFFKKS